MNVSRRRFISASAGAVAAAGLVPSRVGAAAPLSVPAPTLVQTTMVDNTSAAITFAPADKWQSFNSLGSGWYGGTARSTRFLGGSFEYTHPSCTRLKWWSTTKADRGTADVYIDGEFVANISTVNPLLTPTKVVFDSGPLFSGRHTITVVAKTAGWTECDAIEVTEAVHETFVVDDTDPAVFYGGAWAANRNVAGYTNLTAHSTTGANAWFYYSLGNCSRIVWKATPDVGRGTANVYVDDALAATVDLFGPSRVTQQTIFDTGAMTPGSHSIRVVATGKLGAGSGSPWVELDSLAVTGDPMATSRVDGAHPVLVRTRGRIKDTSGALVSAWASSGVAGSYGGSTLASSTQGSFAEISFTSSRIRWIGSRGPDHGIAEVYIDGVLAGTVDTFASVAQPSRVLFDRGGLSTNRFHTIRIRVTRTKQAASSGHVVDVDAFESDASTDPVATYFTQSRAELATIQARTKAYLDPAAWHPIQYAAHVPDGGVALTGGLLKTCFDNNVIYLKHSYSKPNFVDSETFWIKDWPSSNEGRMLMGAGHSLRWGSMLTGADRATLQAVVDTVVANVATRQNGQTVGSANEGFALQWGFGPSEPIAPATQVPTAAQIESFMVNFNHERANYDRAMWTRGMVAAIQSGNSTAGPVLRKMYDWFNRWHRTRPTPVPALVTYSLGAQGHIGSTLAYHSPVGVDDDLVTADRYYVQDWWLQQLANQEPLAFWRYPFNRPHSYLVIALESYFDHYRATGSQKYLDAVLGGWEMFRRDYTYVGGGTSITETAQFPGQCSDLGSGNNEFDGAIFWIHLNQRLLQLFPDQEKYAAEIERCVYNVGLAQQDLNPASNHGIRYHGLLQPRKVGPTIINTCCEVNGTGLYSRLPEMVYSVAADGIFVNLFEASTITWPQAGNDITLSTATTFPSANAVTHTITTPVPIKFAMRVRVPSWSVGPMPISINGAVVATGSPGSYVVLDRTWSQGDTVTYTLGAAPRLTPYRGLSEIDDVDRFALEYGPVLMSYLGSSVGGKAQVDGLVIPWITKSPADLLAALQPVAGNPLRFSVGGDATKVFAPYFQLQTEPFTCFPIVKAP